MVQIDYTDRNQKIYEMVNSAGRAQGTLVKVADHFGLTRQRVSAIIQREDKIRDTSAGHEPFTETMGAWCASQSQRILFDQFCVANGLNNAAAMRQAVDKLLDQPEFEGKEETNEPFDKMLGPWKTTSAQRDAYTALRQKRGWSHAAAMRMAIQLLLTAANQ